MLTKQKASKISTGLVFILVLSMVFGFTNVLVNAEEINDNFDQGYDGWVENNNSTISLVEATSASDKAMQIHSVVTPTTAVSTYLPAAKKTLGTNLEIAAGRQAVVEFKMKVVRSIVTTRQCFSVNSERPLFYFAEEPNGNGAVVAHNNQKIPLDGVGVTLTSNTLLYDPNRWYNFKIVLNPISPAGGTYSIFVDNYKMGVYDLPTTGSDTDFSIIKNVSFSYNVVTAPMTDQTIDMSVNDFKLYSNPLDVVSSSIINDEPDVEPSTSDMTIDFTDELNVSTVNNSNVLVTSNQVSNINYSVSRQSNGGLNNRIKIAFPSGLDEGTRYVVSFKDGLKNAAGLSIADPQKQIAFTTVWANGHLPELYSFENERTLVNTMDGFYFWSTDIKLVDTAHSGKYAITFSGDNEWIYKTYTSPLIDKVITMWVYDTGYTTVGKTFLASADAGAPGPQGVWRAMGVRNENSTEYYVYRIAATWAVSTVKRTVGWHQFKWVQASSGLTTYIDGQQVFTDTQASVKTIQIVDVWGVNPGVPSDAFYFDDIEVRDISAADFKLTSATPANNAQNVSKNQTVTLDFNNAISASTLNNVSVGVLYNDELYPVSATASLVNSKKISISFDDELASGFTYVVSVAPSLRDINGTRIDNPQNISFTIASDSPYTINYNFFKDYGTGQQQEITGQPLQAGDITCKAAASYTGGGAWKATLVLALWKDNKLVKVKIANYPNITGTSQDLVATITVPSLTDGDYKLKALVLKDLTAIAPLPGKATLQE